MNMKKAYYLFLITLITISGCTAGANLKPETDSEYPPARYLTAKGIGQSEGEARNQAVAEISRIFESRVFSDTYDRVKSVIDTSGDETYSQNIESNIRVISMVNLKGVQIAKTWFDDDKKLYYALAVLGKNQARDNWMREMQDLDNMIEGEAGTLNSMGSKFLRLKSMRKILKLWIEREVIVSRLRVLGFDEGRRINYDINSVFRNIPAVKSDMLIFVGINGEYAEAIKKKVSELLSSSGFMLSDTRDKADVLISGTVKIEPVELNNPNWEFARATVSLAIVDADTGSTVGEISENARAGHLSFREAVHKALKKISPSISGKLVKYFEESE
jgi:hypothetical protein